MVYCLVYRLRGGGIKLSAEEALARPVQGELELHGRGFGNLLVVLYKPGTTQYAIPCMDGAQVRRIQRGSGMLIAGTEVLPGRGMKSPSMLFRQTWWCVPQPPPGTAGTSPAAQRPGPGQPAGLPPPSC